MVVAPLLVKPLLDPIKDVLEGLLLGRTCCVDSAPLEYATHASALVDNGRMGPLAPETKLTDSMTEDKKLQPFPVFVPPTHSES